MVSLQYVFRKRFQRDQGPTKDISIRRLWDNNQHERRTCQRRGIRKATATGGRASEFDHINGSRQAGSSRAIYQQCDANTWIADSKSNNRNTATASGKLCVRSNANDRKKRTETTPEKSKPRLYATGSRWILLVIWLSRQSGPQWVFVLQYPARTSECSHQIVSDGRKHKEQTRMIYKVVHRKHG